MRAMVATMALSGLLATGLAAMAVTSATAQDAEDSAPSGGVSAAGLVDRLVEIERDLPSLPPTAAVVDDEETFGQLEGDFLGALTELELVSDQARQLFVDADEADGPVADAVALVARGYLRLEEAYTYLSRYEDYDLARPVDSTDADGVATGADTAAGLVEPGIALIDLARTDALLGYGTLRDSEAADDAEKGLFDAAYRDTQQYLTTLRASTHTLVSASSTAVLVAVQRFEDAERGTRQGGGLRLRPARAVPDGQPRAHRGAGRPARRGGAGPGADPGLPGAARRVQRGDAGGRVSLGVQRQR
jgi:hypothetical protein